MGGHRRISALLLAVTACLTATACGPSQALRENPVVAPAAAQALDQQPAFGSQSSLGAPIQLPPVRTRPAKLWVRSVTDIAAVTSSLAGVAGVAGSAPLRLAQARVTGRLRQGKVRLGAVEPESFRALTPQATADAPGVWRSLVNGEIVFAPEVAQGLQLSLGEQIQSTVTDQLRVGAFASTGTTGVVDAIVARTSPAAADLAGEDTLLVALADGARPDSVAAKIRKVTGLHVDTITPPVTKKAGGRTTIAGFTFRELDNGMIDMDPAWVRAHIVSARVPIIKGAVRCHRMMIPQLRGALGEIEAHGLADQIDVTQYGGCWVPRHIDFNPSKPISMHAWGLAVDLNVSTNALGAQPTMDPRIVQIFQHWGFVWGGAWSRPDGMHFQLGALLAGIQG